MEIKTDHKPREILFGFQLTDAERKEFDYIDSSEIASWDDAEFVRYKGRLYDLHDTEPGPGSSGMPDELKEWGAYVPDTYFSGVVFRFVEVDGEYCVIAGTYYTG